MNSSVHDGPLWSRRRFWGVVGVLFVLQAGLILLFGDRSHTALSIPSPSVHFRALGLAATEDELLREFFVGDPAVFPLPNPRGFSGRGWMDQAPMSYKHDFPLERPIPLSLTNPPTIPAPLSRFILNLISGFGTDFPSFLSRPEPTISGLAEQQTRREEPLPVFLAPEIIPTQSVFRLQGGLSDRLIGAAPGLRTWPSDKLLVSTVVQIAVNPQGDVVAARLDASCGLAEADADAVTKTRALRFRPSQSAGTVWGQAIFQWQTTEPSAAVPPK
jgi:hypothetical protein